MKIPKRFYIDHIERDLEAPDILRETKHHYYIDASQREALAELLSDADFYADWLTGNRNYDSYLFGIITSAVATAKAIRSQLDQ